MDIDPRILPLLNDREIWIIATHGDQMAALAWDGAAATTGRQRHFVDAVVARSRAPSDEFEHVWIKFAQLVELIRQVDQAVAQIAVLSETLEATRKELAVARRELDAWDRAVAFTPWNAAVTALLGDAAAARLSDANRSAITRHGYLRIMNVQGVLPHELYSTLADQTGLSVAIHNLEKIRRIQREGLPQFGGSKDVSSLAREERCNACDRPLSRCICGV